MIYFFDIILDDNPFERAETPFLPRVGEIIHYTRRDCDLPIKEPETLKMVVTDVYHELERITSESYTGSAMHTFVKCKEIP